MSQQSQNDHYPDRRALALDYADALNEEIRDLQAAGAEVIQVDEPYMQSFVDDARAYAVEAINRALEGISGPTVLHTCFGYGHFVKEKKGRIDNGYPFLVELVDTRADQLAIEAAQPDLDLTVLERLGDKTVVLGVVDLGTSDVETPEEVAERIRACPPSPAAGAPGRRAGLRDEVPRPRRRVRQAAGDGGRNRHRAGPNCRVEPCSSPHAGQRAFLRPGHRGRVERVMAHQHRRDARRRGAQGMRGPLPGRLLVASGLAALALLVVLGPRIDLLERLSRSAPDGTTVSVGAARWSLGPTHQGSPYVLVPDAWSGTEQVARPLSGPGPLLLAATVEVLAVALAWALPARGRRWVRRWTTAGMFRRRGPPATTATQSSLLPRA